MIIIKTINNSRWGCSRLFNSIVMLLNKKGKSCIIRIYRKLKVITNKKIN